MQVEQPRTGIFGRNLTHAGLHSVPTMTESAGLATVTPLLPATAALSSDTNLACDLVKTALNPASHVDFPHITRICDRLEEEPAELPGVVHLLAGKLCDKQANQSERLKVLTIANEMLYSSQVIAAFREVNGLRESLVSLRQLHDSGADPVADENIRMLANEVERNCFAGVNGEKKKQRPKRPHFSFSGAAAKLDRAASRAFQHTERTLERTASSVSSAMEKAEKKLERAASQMFEEAERAFGIPPSSPPASRGYPASSSSRASISTGASAQPPLVIQDGSGRGRLHPAQQPVVPRLAKEATQSTFDLEERQLQWALSASLMEAHGQPQNPQTGWEPPNSTKPRARPVKPRAQASASPAVVTLELRDPMAEGLCKIDDADAHAAFLEHEATLVSERWG